MPREGNNSEETDTPPPDGSQPEIKLDQTSSKKVVLLFFTSIIKKVYDKK